MRSIEGRVWAAVKKAAIKIDNWWQEIGDIRHLKPKDYGIRSPISSTVAQTITVNRQYIFDPIEIGRVRGRATWLTTPDQDQSVDWVINPHGLASPIGIQWIEENGKLIPQAVRQSDGKAEILPDQKIEETEITNLPDEAAAAVISIHYKEKHLKEFLLCLRLPGADWSQNIAAVVDGESFVSGMRVHSGLVRDVCTGVRHGDIPFEKSLSAANLLK